MYFLYRHIRLDKNEVFYIGIGKTQYNPIGGTYSIKTLYRRAFDKTKSRNNHWKNITSKTDYTVEIVLLEDCVEKIQEKEKEFILIYKDTICNMTEGGAGIVSYNHTPETRLKISQSTKGVPKSTIHKANINKAKLKPVILSKDGFSREFESILASAIFLGDKGYQSNLASVANGKRKIAYGYKVQFKNAEL